MTTEATERTPLQAGSLVRVASEVPVGTRVTRANPLGGSIWTRTEGGYGSSNGLHRSTETVDNWMREAGGWVVVGDTSGASGDANADTTIETPAYAPDCDVPLDQFKQVFRTTMMGAWQGAGVSDSPVLNALEALEVPEYEPAIGMALCCYDHLFKEKLPENTVVASGLDPTLENHTVYRSTGGGGFTKILGANVQMNSTYRRFYIVGMPEAVNPPWHGSESEPEEVIAFKARAWKMASRVKSNTGWCGEVWNAMNRADIQNPGTEASRTAVSAEQASRLPEGTILRFSSGTSSILYVRDNSADNPAKTRRIAGNLPGSWKRTGMEPVYHPGRTMRIPVNSTHEMEFMPVGTFLGDGGNVRWERLESPPEGQRPGAWWAHVVSGGYRSYYTSDQFGSGRGYYYVVIP